MRFTNQTNNGLERYNKRFNGLFSKHNLSLLEFIEIVEKESQYYATKMANIHNRKEALQTRRIEQTIPQIPQAYKAFKASQQNRSGNRRR